MKLLDRLSLRAKTALCVAGVILLTGLAGTLFTREILTVTLRGELGERGRTVATGLEARGADHILRGDFFELHQMLQETRSKSKDIRYIFVLDPRGNIIDHTFESGFPMDLLSLPPPESGLDYREQRLQTEEGFIRDIAVPVFDGRAGVIHVGMTETYLNAAVGGAVRNLLIATAVALLAGVALAWFFAGLVSRPILRLVGVADAVGGGDLTRRASLATQDEVGRLGKAFDAMTEQLATRIDELEVSNVRLSALNNIATLVSRTAPLDDMLSEILDELLDLVQADAGGMLFRGYGGESGYWAHRGFSQAYVEGIAGLMLSKDGAEHILDFGEYPASEFKPLDGGLLRWIEGEGLQAFVSTPFRVKGEMPGALHVARRAQRPFTPRERELLSSVAAQTGIMLTNRQLLREASQAEALRQLNQMKSEFAIRASHELRTPATAIKGYIETLLRPDMALDVHEQKQLLKDMDEVSDRLNRLIRDVLNVAHLESGALDVKRERLALSPLLQRVTRRLGRQSYRHRLVVRLDSNLGDVLGDADRLEDVLENLISNAFKYSPQGGTVTVSARNSSSSKKDGSRPQIAKAPELQAKPTGFVTISVADNGMGIPSSEVPKLFQQFYQVPDKRSDRSRGIGMGLFICKSYVEAMGGSIWVESEEGRGSIFSFTVPAAEPSPELILRQGQTATVARQRRR
jgi:signal transduction histidine kinase